MQQLSSIPRYKVSTLLLVGASLLGVLTVYTGAVEFAPKLRIAHDLSRRILIGFQIALALALAISSLYYVAAPAQFQLSDRAKKAGAAIKYAEERITLANAQLAALNALPADQQSAEEKAKLEAELKEAETMKLNAMTVCQFEAKQNGLPYGPADDFVSSCLRQAYRKDLLIADQAFLLELTKNDSVVVA